LEKQTTAKANLVDSLGAEPPKKEKKPRGTTVVLLQSRCEHKEDNWMAT